MIQLIWSKFSEAQVDPFASQESSHCALWYSLTEGPLGIDALALSLKMAFLIVLTSLKRVGNLQALSISDSCLEFGLDFTHIILRPPPGYVPKVPITSFREQVVNLQAFPPEEGNLVLSLLCPVCALHIYVDRTQSFRQSGTPPVALWHWQMVLR